MSNVGFDPSALLSSIQGRDTMQNFGRITKIIGLVIEAVGPNVSIGEYCRILTKNGGEILAEVVGFKDERVLLMPLGEMKGVGPGSQVMAVGEPLKIRVGEELLGRILDGLGEPRTGPPLHPRMERVDVHNLPPDPLTRKRITEPVQLGIRAIDGLLTCGKGQRLGIFSGSGVGKSTLLGMMARNTRADINVIGLIGERGREVLDFVVRDLGEEGLKRTIMVVVTSDQPALLRVKGAFVTTAIAEYFRDKGMNVLLMMDSVTRFAFALREVGLATGEPPATRGYPPSVFATIPQLLERAGNSAEGTMTGLYTVLVEGDDLNEPISDTVRGILDGHIVLSRDLAARNHYPAIDVLASVSRLMPEITSDAQQQRAGEFLKLLASYQDAKDMIDIGAYKRGSDPVVDLALKKIHSMNAFLQQRVGEKCSYEETEKSLVSLMEAGV